MDPGSQLGGAGPEQGGWGGVGSGSEPAQQGPAGTGTAGGVGGRRRGQGTGHCVLCVPTHWQLSTLHPAQPPAPPAPCLS